MKFAKKMHSSAHFPDRNTERFNLMLKQRPPYAQKEEVMYGISQLNPMRMNLMPGSGKYVALGLAGLLLAFCALGGCVTYDSHYHPVLDARLANDTAFRDNMPEKYGLIVSGMTEKRCADTNKIAYDMLLSNGYSKDDIYVLDSDGSQRQYPVDAPASRESLCLVMDHLAKKAGPEDDIFVYIGDHGGVDVEGPRFRPADDAEVFSLIMLSGDIVSDKEFANYLHGIGVGQGILFAGQCYGGGFAEEAGKGNFTGVSSSEPDGESSSLWNGVDFDRTFFQSFGKKEADENDDGNVSVREAFDYAKENFILTSQGNETPCIFSEKDPSEVFL